MTARALVPWLRPSCRGRCGRPSLGTARLGAGLNGGQQSDRPPAFSCVACGEGFAWLGDLHHNGRLVNLGVAGQAGSGPVTRRLGVMVTSLWSGCALLPEREAAP